MFHMHFISFNTLGEAAQANHERRTQHDHKSPLGPTCSAETFRAMLLRSSRSPPVVTRPLAALEPGPGVELQLRFSGKINICAAQTSKTPQSNSNILSESNMAIANPFFFSLMISPLESLR